MEIVPSHQFVGIKNWPIFWLLSVEMELQFYGTLNLTNPLRVSEEVVKKVM